MTSCRQYFRNNYFFSSEINMYVYVCRLLALINIGPKFHCFVLAQLDVIVCLQATSMWCVVYEIV